MSVIGSSRSVLFFFWLHPMYEARRGFRCLPQATQLAHGPCFRRGWNLCKKIMASFPLLRPRLGIGSQNRGRGKGGQKGLPADSANI